MDYTEILDRFISVFFPQRCLFCGEVVEYDDFWCGRCAIDGKPPIAKHGRVERDSRHSFADALAAAQFSGGVRKLIWRLKEKDDRRILRFFAGEMLAVMSEHWGLAKFDAVVPVPSTASKMKERGFNPAEMLARHVGRGAGIPVHSGALMRLEATKVQRGLTAAERRVNAAKSYALGMAESLTGKTVLLVDDVFTTGSTADACSRKLLEAGANSVYVVTAAFTKLDDERGK